MGTASLVFLPDPNHPTNLILDVGNSTATGGIQLFPNGGIIAPPGQHDMKFSVGGGGDWEVVDFVLSSANKTVGPILESQYTSSFSILDSSGKAHQIPADGEVGVPAGKGSFITLTNNNQAVHDYWYDIVVKSPTLGTRRMDPAMINDGSGGQEPIGPFGWTLALMIFVCGLVLGLLIGWIYKKLNG